MDQSIKSSIIGRRIKEIRTKSFYINRKLICKVIVVYIKVDSGKWYSFTSSDGNNKVKQLEQEPQLLQLDQISDSFAYPIGLFQSNFSNKKVVEINEYEWKGKVDEGYGFYIELEGNCGYSVLEKDDCLIFREDNG